jgi:hypothetical protein
LILVAERFADGPASRQELADLFQTVFQRRHGDSRTADSQAVHAALAAAFHPDFASLHPDIRSLHVVPPEQLPLRVRMPLAAAVHASGAVASAANTPTNYRLDDDPTVEECLRIHHEAEAAEEVEQAIILRDLVGPLARTSGLDPRCLTPEVVDLARAAYACRHWPTGRLEPARLAVLADALEEAGVVGEVLAHLRGAAPHYRGCFAVDLCLGLS